MNMFDETAESDRIPPGQYFTERFPVLHAGVTPSVDLATWSLVVDGLVDVPSAYSYDDVLAMPAADVVHDIHCVTKWSKLDTRWRGVPVADIVGPSGVQEAATHVLMTAEHGFTANLPIEDFMADGNVFAYEFDGAQLELEHGWPLRLVVPHLYFWKSVKWIRQITFMDHDEPGFWERNGYHMYGDPWKEQRYWGD